MGASMQEASVEQGTSTDTTEFDAVDVTDVVVLGTGAAGLTAALAAARRRCVGRGVREGRRGRAARARGRAAWCGSRSTDHEAELGIADSRDEVLTYLASLSHDMIDEKLAAAYVDTGPEMVRVARGQHAGARSGSSRASPTTTPSTRGEARRGPVARVPAVPLRRARPVGRAR